MVEKMNVLVVDDAAFMRKAVSQILASDPGLRVQDMARNGLEAIEKIKKNPPDVVILDIDMPVMDGITAIKHIMIECPVPIVVLSSITSEGSVTFEALRLGVVDFVPKPSGAISVDIDASRQELIDRIKVARHVNLDNVRRVRLPRKWEKAERLEKLYGFKPLEYIVIVGTTLSGPNTVIRLMSRLSPTLPAAVIVQQEISPRIIDSFVTRFNAHVPCRIETAKDGQAIEQGCCYISSNEHTVRLELDAGGVPCLKLSKSAGNPLDQLFSSAAAVFGENTIGVLLTGIGTDGAGGFARIRNASGTTIVQDTNCCVYPNLTHNAIEKGVADMILDETELPCAVESLIGQAEVKPSAGTTGRF